jgi:hypothetical protein
MKILLASWLVAGGLFLSVAGVAQAQDSTSTQPGSTATSAQNDYNTPTDDSYNAAAPDTSNPNVRTLSGCLQQGAGANEFALFGSNANSWELVSNSVDLAAHVGQAVEIAFVNQSNSSSDGSRQPLIVTDLVMVSSSCSW